MNGSIVYELERPENGGLNKTLKVSLLTHYRPSSSVDVIMAQKISMHANQHMLHELACISFWCSILILLQRIPF